MISIPQPHVSTAGSKPSAGGPPGSGRPPRAPRGRGAIVAIVIGCVGAALGVGFGIAFFTFGLNPLVLVLGGVIVVCSLASVFFRFIPQSLPGLRLIRTAAGFLSIAAIAGLMYFVVYPAAHGGPATSWIPNWGIHAAAPPRSSTATVVYDVTGTAPIASIRLAPGSDNGGATSVQTLPFTRTVSVDATASTFYTLTASTTNVPAASTVTCTITVDGVIVSSQTGSGSFAPALCSGRAGDGSQ